MTALTRFDVDRGGCYYTNHYDQDEEQDVPSRIGWFVVMGGEIRRYECEDREGKTMIILVEVREGRYGGSDLTVWLWEWDRKIGK